MTPPLPGPEGSGGPDGSSASAPSCGRSRSASRLTSSSAKLVATFLALEVARGDDGDEERGPSDCAFYPALPLVAPLQARTVDKQVELVASGSQTELCFEVRGERPDTVMIAVVISMRVAPECCCPLRHCT